MAKKKSSKRTDKKKIPVKTDISSVEKETIKRADRTITSIEKFLAKWDASKIKNDAMNPQIEKIRRFHSELVKWQKDALKGHRDADKTRLRRLQEFVIICRNYS